MLEQDHPTSIRVWSNRGVEVHDQSMPEPVSDQVAAHETYLRLSEQLAALEVNGDVAGARRLRPRVASAKRHWHELARRSDAAMRDTRPQA